MVGLIVGLKDGDSVDDSSEVDDGFEVDDGSKFVGSNVVVVVVGSDDGNDVVVGSDDGGADGWWGWCVGLMVVGSDVVGSNDGAIVEGS